MRHKIILLLLLSTYINTAFSQEKIKGNKTITRIKTDLNLFQKIVISNDFHVSLIKSENSFIEIETDENIHEVIDINDESSTLTISTDYNIRAKRLNITVYYEDFWFNVRKSNTEPLIRINAEADTEEGLDKILKSLNKVMSLAK